MSKQRGEELGWKMTRRRENDRRDERRNTIEIIGRRGREREREVSIISHICAYFKTSTTKINIQYWTQLATFCLADSPKD